MSSLRGRPIRSRDPGCQFAAAPRQKHAKQKRAKVTAVCQATTGKRGTHARRDQVLPDVKLPPRAARVSRPILSRKTGVAPVLEIGGAVSSTSSPMASCCFQSTRLAASPSPKRSSTCCPNSPAKSSGQIVPAQLAQPPARPTKRPDSPNAPRPAKRSPAPAQNPAVSTGIAALRPALQGCGNGVPF